MAEKRLEEIRSVRSAKRQAMLDAGQVPYPAEARRDFPLAHLLYHFDDLQRDGSPITVAGRVRAIRSHGGVVFMDISDASASLQLQLIKKDIPEAVFAQLAWLDVGDFIEASGGLTTTARGVHSLAVREFHLLSKSLRPLPSSWYGLKEHEARFRQREIDLLLNQEVRTVFEKRSRIIDWLRTHLASQGFQEVETPILQPIPGGAAARPFTTHHNALDMSLYLRIAPELYLKRLIIGGFEKVFEIGRNFRNEGVSPQHNPEFTMAELYWAYADYEDLMDFTDQLLGKLTADLFAETTKDEKTAPVTFSPPLPRVRYVELVSTRLKLDILAEKDPQAYLSIFKQEKLDLPAAITYPKLVDELYKKLIRPKIEKPTILYDYPIELSPLAKRSASDPRIAEQFQVVVKGTELVKAYSELNDPVEQRARFEEQQAARAGGDEEAQFLDEQYLRAMEYGMPPTAGWGMGIDRLVTLLTGVENIRDTILFPLLKPEDKQ